MTENLSIIIPTYNYDCSALIHGLCSQGRGLKRTHPNFSFEIVVADDGSSEKELVRRVEQAISQDSDHCRLISMGRNSGRTATCNRLFEEARGQWLLLIDDDATLRSDSFLADYWTNRHKADVVCGGLVNPPGIKPGCELRHCYEHHAEQRRTVAWRTAHPFEVFSTFNVMFRSDIIKNIGFDRRCQEYGYEDILLGINLSAAGATILHIDNPMVHEGIDANASFLAKTEASMRTLYRLTGPMQRSAGASRMKHKLEHLHLASLFYLFFTIFRPLIRRNLLSRHPSLFLFNVYKTGYYMRVCKHEGRGR